MNLHRNLIVITLTALLAGQVYGFDLFDPNRGKPPEAPKPPPAPAAPVKPPTPTPTPPPSPPKPLPPQKDFALRGTSRIGDKLVAVLQAPDGKSVVQLLKNNQRTPLDGYSDYILLNVDPNNRTVRLEYPKELPCRDSNAQKGVQCEENGTIATLKLVALSAIAPQQPVPTVPPPVVVSQVPPAVPGQPGAIPGAVPGQPGAIPGQPGMVPGQPAASPTGVPPASPFATTARPAASTPEEIQKREEERRKREELYKNFKRQTIEDKDVPPGMRVVRTPFGDRLVPDNTNNPQPTPQQPPPTQ